MAHPQFQFNHCNKNLETALHQAAQQDNATLIKYIVERAPQLLERGNISQKTALWLAAIGGKSKAVETLLELGANPNITIRTSNELIKGYQVDSCILNALIIMQLRCVDKIRSSNLL